MLLINLFMALRLQKFSSSVSILRRRQTFVDWTQRINSLAYSWSLRRNAQDLGDDNILQARGLIDIRVGETGAAGQIDIGLVIPSAGRKRHRSSLTVALKEIHE